MAPTGFGVPDITQYTCSTYSTCRQVWRQPEPL